VLAPCRRRSYSFQWPPVRSFVHSFIRPAGSGKQERSDDNNNNNSNNWQQMQLAKETKVGH